MKRRELIGTAVFLGLVATVMGLTWWTIELIGQPKSAVREKRESADLVRCYIVDADQGPTFELQDSDRVVKLITHAELPRYEKNARILYGFHIQITDADGAPLWETDLYTRTRQSKDTEKDGVFLEENTFSVIQGVEYGDDRLLELRLPDHLPNGALMTLRLLGTSDPNSQVRRALIRAYRQIDRSSVAQRLRLLSLSLARKRTLARRVGVPWDLIPADRRLSLLAYRWDRMAALGEAGTDFQTRLILYTGFRTRPEEDDGKQGIRVHALHAAAINVLAMERVDLTLKAIAYSGVTRCELPDPKGIEVMDKTDPVALELDIVPGDGAPEHPISHRSVTIPPLEKGIEYNLSIPSGLHSIHIRTDSLAGAVVCLDANRRHGLQFGNIEPIRVNEDTERLIVDVRRLPAYVSGTRSGMSNGQPPIVTRIDGPTDIDSRTYLIEARVLMDDRHWIGEAPVLSYRFLDARGRTVSAGSTPMAPTFAPFEKVRLPTPRTAKGWLAPDGAPAPENEPDARASASRDIDEIADGSSEVAEDDSDGGDGFWAQWVGAPGEPTAESLDEHADDDTALEPVSEPIRLTIIAPSNATSLELSTDRESVLRVLGYLGDESKYEAPYADYLPNDLIWRYAPRERRRWFPTRPANRDVLAKTGRIARVRTQVRLEPTATDTPEVGERVAVLLEPVRPPERQLILERVPDDRLAETIATWPVGMYTSLARQPTIDVPSGGQKRPKLRYYIRGQSDHLLGISIDIKVGDSVVSRRRLATPRGVWTMPYLPPGLSTISCAPTADDTVPEERRAELTSQLACYLDLPPDPKRPAVIVRARTVYPLDHRTLRLLVQKKPGRDVVVNAVVYDQRVTGREGRYIHGIIDGNDPRRTVGTPVRGITRAERWWPLPPARALVEPVFTDLATRTPGFPRTISMRLGDDLSPGQHVIELEAPAMAGWVRFFTYDVDPDVRESAWQWRFEAPDSPPGPPDSGGDE